MAAFIPSTVLISSENLPARAASAFGIDNVDKCARTFDSINPGTLNSVYFFSMNERFDSILPVAISRLSPGGSFVAVVACGAPGSYKTADDASLALILAGFMNPTKSSVEGSDSEFSRLLIYLLINLFIYLS